MYKREDISRVKHNGGSRWNIYIKGKEKIISVANTWCEHNGISTPPPFRTSEAQHTPETIDFACAILRKKGLLAPDGLSFSADKAQTNDKIKTSTSTPEDIFWGLDKPYKFPGQNEDGTIGPHGRFL